MRYRFIRIPGSAKLASPRNLLSRNPRMRSRSPAPADIQFQPRSKHATPDQCRQPESKRASAISAFACSQYRACFQGDHPRASKRLPKTTSYCDAASRSFSGRLATNSLHVLGGSPRPVTFPISFRPDHLRRGSLDGLMRIGLCDGCQDSRGLCLPGMSHADLHSTQPWRQSLATYSAI